jgi:hypothetical protein
MVLESAKNGDITNINEHIATSARRFIFWVFTKVADSPSSQMSTCPRTSLWTSFQMHRLFHGDVRLAWIRISQDGINTINCKHPQTIVETNCCGDSLIARTVSCGLFYQAHYQRALQRCEDGVLSRIGLRMPSKSQAASMGSEEAFVRDVLKRPGGVGKTGENMGFFMGNLRRNCNGKLL